MILGRRTALFARPAPILRTYRRSDLTPDLVAGLTVALVVLPQAVAYSLLAGMPPQSGLYAAVVAAVAAALWGSAALLQTGPTNTSSLLTLSALVVIASPGTPEYVAAAALLALLAGLIRVALGVARLGLLVRFISDSVIVGFTAGAAFLIVANQVHNLLGLGAPATAHLAQALIALVPELARSQLPSLALGIGTALVIVGLRRAAPRVPGALIGMVAASVVAVLIGDGVRTVGAIPRGFPAPSLPALEWPLVAELANPALAIAAIGLVEAVSIARGLGLRAGERLDSDQEFVGQGLANIACSLFAGYPVSASFVRSALNQDSGARTALASAFSGLFVLIALFTVGPLVAYVPLPALAGVLLLAAWSLVDRREIRRIWRSGGGDRAIMLATFLATLLLPLQYAVLGGIGMSLAYYLLKTSTPRVRQVVPDRGFRHFEPHAGHPVCPQLAVVEVLGDLYFGAVQHVEDQLRRIREAAGQRFLLLRMHGVENCDISGIHALEGLVRAYRQAGGDVYAVRVRNPVRAMLRSSGLDLQLGEDHFLPEDEAISHLFYRVLDPAICIYECPERVFQECQNLPKQLGPDHLRWPGDDRGGAVSTVEPGALWEALHRAEPPVVLDVREPREFRQGHVPGAQSLPLPALIGDPALVPMMGQVVLVCRGGRRSGRAAHALAELGYENVAALRGGMLAWEAANLLEAID